VAVAIVWNKKKGVNVVKEEGRKKWKVRDIIVFSCISNFIKGKNETSCLKS